MDDDTNTLDEIAEGLGEVKVSNNYLEEVEVEKGEQFGYD
jgi:hypothetical protein